MHFVSGLESVSKELDHAFRGLPDGEVTVTEFEQAVVSRLESNLGLGSLALPRLASSSPRLLVARPFQPRRGARVTAGQGALP